VCLRKVSTLSKWISGLSVVAIRCSGQIGQSHPPRRMLLPKDDLSLGPVERPPAADTPLQCSTNTWHAVILGAAHDLAVDPTSTVPPLERASRAWKRFFRGIRERADIARRVATVDKASLKLPQCLASRPTPQRRGSTPGRQG